MTPHRRDCLVPATWLGASDTTDTSAFSAGADYVLQLER
jgi:hypothetical protein